MAFSNRKPARNGGSDSYSSNYSAPAKTSSSYGPPPVKAKAFVDQYFKSNSNGGSSRPGNGGGPRSSSSSRPQQSYSAPQSPAGRSYDRFQNRNEYVHGGGYTLRNAWQGGGNRSRGGYGGGRGGNRGGRGGGRGEYMDSSRFIKKAVARVEQKIEITHKFTDFNFPEIVQKNLEAKGYTTPSPIQDKAIKHVQAGRDIIGLASTGTGKTAAFLLPLLEKVLKDPQEQSVLILAPTRELAIQIDDELRMFGKGLKLFSAICVGGVPAYGQIQDLRRNPHFVIGTPGRIQDLADRGFINFKIYNNVVLDEVDHMLDMGFVEPITDILSHLPAERQSLFFSATMPDRIRSLIGKFVKDPVLVEIQSGKTTDNVDQDVVRVQPGKNKFDTLVEILKRPEVSKVLIFSETKSDVERLYDNLRVQGFKAASIHGDKRQRERQRALGFFKDNTINILVATDVAARGIDVKDITHVINYTIPQTHDDYVHRIGRTGRGNSTGTALTFV